MLRHPCILGDPQTKRGKIRIGRLTPAFSGAHKRAEMLCHPCILRDPQTKGDKIKIGCLTPAFSGAHKRAEMLCHPCILGDPQTKGDKIRIGFLTLAFPGAQKRAELLGKATITGTSFPLMVLRGSVVVGTPKQGTCMHNHSTKMGYPFSLAWTTTHASVLEMGVKHTCYSYIL